MQLQNIQVYPKALADAFWLDNSSKHFGWTSDYRVAFYLVWLQSPYKYCILLVSVTGSFTTTSFSNIAAIKLNVITLMDVPFFLLKCKYQNSYRGYCHKMIEQIRVPIHCLIMSLLYAHHKQQQVVSYRHHRFV